MSLLVWIVSNALAAPPITQFGCANPPCVVAILSSDHHIVPPDVLRVTAAAIAPTRLEWVEVTLTEVRGSVDVTINGVRLDPADGLQDDLLGTTRWVFAVQDAAAPIDVEVYNASSRAAAAYELVGHVLVEHR